MVDISEPDDSLSVDVIDEPSSCRGGGAEMETDRQMVHRNWQMCHSG